jgi:predicted alpha/beta-fold hydrolase
MIAELPDERVSEERARSLLAKVSAAFKNNPFIPHRLFRQGDAQTLGGYLWPKRFRLRDQTGDEERFFEVGPGSQVLARCRWQPNRTNSPTLVMWHGLEGSSGSAYMLTTAAKVFQRGFNVVRMNIRNCGQTEHLTPTLYHGGLTDDLRVVIEELIKDGLSRIVIAGFSLGGNMVLKLAGEYGDAPPPEIKAVGAVSPSIDLSAGRYLLNLRRNFLYQKDFLFSLKRRIRLKQKLYPGSFDISELNRVRTIEQFDDRFVAPAFGFTGVDDYYARASSRPYIGRIRIPTLIIHAKDDPFVPFTPLTDPTISANPFVMVLMTEKGGHVAFVSSNPGDEDRFWAENRLAEFCELAAGEPPLLTLKA